jgi:DNA-binding MurR/RpiR family transcriptional regulator
MIVVDLVDAGKGRVIVILHAIFKELVHLAHLQQAYPFQGQGLARGFNTSRLATIACCQLLTVKSSDRQSLCRRAAAFNRMVCSTCSQLFFGQFTLQAW